EGHEAFCQEKDSLLPAAREVSAYLQTDDTSAKHRGKGGHTLHIGNDLFASFFTTDTKSRVNFLKILLTPHQSYLFKGPIPKSGDPKRGCWLGYLKRRRLDHLLIITWGG